MRPVQRGAAVPVGADRHHLGAIGLVRARVEQGLQVGACPGGEHDQATGHASLSPAAARAGTSGGRCRAPQPCLGTPGNTHRRWHAAFWRVTLNLAPIAVPSWSSVTFTGLNSP